MKPYIRFSMFLCLLILWGCAAPPTPVVYSTPEAVTKEIPPSLQHPPAERELLAFVGMENKSIYAADKLWDIASHLLTTRLVEIGYFSVVDWERMKQNYDSVRLKNASLVSRPSDFRSVRDELSCDLFLGGAITYYDVSQSARVSAISKNKTMTTTVRVDLWLQDAQNGEYVSAASGNGRAVQQFTGGLLGGNIGTWDINVANKSLNLAIDDALIKMLTIYKERRKNRKTAPASSYRPEPLPPAGNPSENGGEVHGYPDRSFSVPDLSAFRRNSNKWALIIGVSRFMDQRINPLDYTAKDAKAVYQYLVDPNYGKFLPEQVFLLTDSDATSFNIKLYLDIISKHAKSEDMVVIFISSHGTPGSMDVEGVGYLATYDTLVDSLYATAFNMSDLVSAVNKRMKARTVVTLADACYSAGTFKDVKFLTMKGAKDLVVASGNSGIQKEMVKGALQPGHSGGFGIADSTVRQMSSGSGRLFITSSRVDERSWESDRLQHGFFTYYLLEALKMKGGQIPIRKAFDYIQKKIPAEVMKEKGAPQHPVLGIKDVKGDICLGIPPAI